MKKIILASILLISITSIRAQTGDFQDVYFNNLYGGMIKNNPTEQPNYHISNTSTGFGGDWGLDVKWWGGVKLRSALGLLYLTRDGNVGIGKEPTLAKLDIDGNLRTSANITGSDFISAGANSWMFHTPDDSRRTLHIAPGLPDGQFDWSRATIFNNTGDVAVSGKLEAKEVKVTQTPTADFVFEENYGLPKLEDVEKHIKESKHLPEIASAKEMEKNGVNIGEFQMKLLQKIEELTLYVIEQNKQIKKLMEMNKNLKEEVDQIKLETTK